MSLCAFDWCTNTDGGHEEHIWSDGVDGSSLIGQLRRVSVWNSIQDGFNEPIAVSIEGAADVQDGGAESWLTVEQATYLRDALARAIENAGTRG